MKNIQQFYILGLPVETDIGEIDFLKVRDYPDYIEYINIMSMNKNHLIYNFTKQNKDGLYDDLIQFIKDNPLSTISVTLPDLKLAYDKVFNKVFVDENSRHLISEETFDYYRRLILRMSCFKEEEINPNPEIQEWIEKSKRVKNKDNNTTFQDIVTSVATYSGFTYKEINEFSIYQLQHTFHQISNFKNYDTTTLFSTVSPKEVEIKSWFDHIDLFKDDKHFLSESEFKKGVGSVFDDE